MRNIVSQTFFFYSIKIVSLEIGISSTTVAGRAVLTVQNCQSYNANIPISNPNIIRFSARAGFSDIDALCKTICQQLQFFYFPFFLELPFFAISNFLFFFGAAIFCFLIILASPIFLFSFFWSLQFLFFHFFLSLHFCFLFLY